METPQDRPFTAQFRHDDGTVTMLDNGRLTVFSPGPDGLAVTYSGTGRGECIVAPLTPADRGRLGRLARLFD